MVTHGFYVGTPEIVDYEAIAVDKSSDCTGENGVFISVGFAGVIDDDGGGARGDGESAENRIDIVVAAVVDAVGDAVGEFRPVLKGVNIDESISESDAQGVAVGEDGEAVGGKGIGFEALLGHHIAVARERCAVVGFACVTTLDGQFYRVK